MILEVEFEEINQEVEIEMDEVNIVSDGGYDKGYAEGKADGYQAGYDIGFNNGQSSAVSQYTHIDFCQFSGDQTIDTGIICTQDTKIKAVFTREKSSAQYLYGVASADNQASVTAYLSNGGTWRFGDKRYSISIDVSEDFIQTAIVDKKGFVFSKVDSGISSLTDFKTISTLTIGSCRNANGTLGTPQFDGKIFHFSIWQGEELVLNLCPVVTADGEYGFLNSIDNVFYGSITDVPLDGGNL